MIRYLFFLLLFFLFSDENLSSSLKGHLYGINQSFPNSSFVQITNNSSNYDRLLNLGPLSISGDATAMKTTNNENYVVTYHTFDSLGVPHYFLLTINLKNRIEVKSNLSITGDGYGSFWQISDDEKQFVGIRESAHSGATLEVAIIDPIKGYVKTVGLYPYGDYSLVMGFASKRRLYYNIINSNLFCAINVDTGTLDINIIIPNEYLIYAFIYDSTTDRLISLVYSDKVIEKAWFIASIIIDKHSSIINFERIGNSTIPMGKNYLWSTTYTLATNERQWITLWANENSDESSTLINFNIDTGNIIQKQIINRSKDLNNLVYFD